MYLYVSGLILLLVPGCWAAAWTTGQAARAVIGQNSFSSRAGTMNPIGLTITGRQLHVADAARRVLSYDLAPILSSSVDGPCAVCLAPASAALAQSVPSSQARYALYRQSIAVVDTPNHRVLFWRNASLPSAAAGPDVILSDDSYPEPSSVALDGQYLYIGDSSARRVFIWKLASLSAGQAPDAVLGNGDQGAGAAATASPVALLADAGNLFVADAANHRVLLFTPGESVLAADKVISTASHEKVPLAPGALVTLRGDHLSTRSDSAIDTGHDPLPSTLADTELLVDGHPVPLMAVGPQEIRAQVPYTLNYTASASIHLRWANGQVSAPIALPVQSVSPAIFSFPAGPEPRTGVALHAFPTGLSGSPVTEDDPAKPGETVSIWASGLGALATADANQPVSGKPNAGSPSPVRAQVEAFVNDQPVEVVSAVLPPGSIGIYEVRIIVPADLPPDANIKLLLREANVQSNIVSVPVAAAASTIHN